MASAYVPVNPTIGLIKQILQASPALKDQIAWDAWAAEQTMLGEKVALFREYADGEHRAKLTTEMKHMLRIPVENDASPFAINHMDNLIQTVSDRIDLTGIEGSTAEATGWIEQVGKRNRLSALQLEITESALRDGDTYMLAAWDNAAREVRWTHEEAFDGTEGMLVIYGRDKRAPAAALKVWLEAVNDNGKVENRARVNVYWPNRVQKYLQNGSKLEPTGPAEPWTIGAQPSGEALGVPVVQFANQSKRYSTNGMSILDSVVPIQDAVNRTVTSMIMAAELTAFRLRYLFGIEAPKALQPGMWINMFVKDKAGRQSAPSQDDREWLNAIRIGDLQQGDLSQLMAQAQFLIDAIYEVSRIPRNDGTNESGEAKKQREAGLLGRVRRCHISLGSAWEQLAAQSARIQAAFGDTPPASESWDTKWKAPEVRNDTEVVDNALKIADRLDEETFLTIVAPVYQFDAAKIRQVMARRAAEANARARTLLPLFDGSAIDDETDDAA